MFMYIHTSSWHTSPCCALSNTSQKKETMCHQRGRQRITKGGDDMLQKGEVTCCERGRWHVAKEEDDASQKGEMMHCRRGGNASQKGKAMCCGMRGGRGRQNIVEWEATTQHLGHVKVTCCALLSLGRTVPKRKGEILASHYRQEWLSGVCL